MRVEVLLSTMFLDDISSFLKLRNIDSDIIIGNQCDKNENLNLEYNNHSVIVLSRNERGVGKNRNASLFYSNADVVIFADNDVTYADGYAKKVIDFYEKHPKAEVVIFNFKEQRGNEEVHDLVLKNKKAGKRDLTRFGTFAITARREALLRNRISFSLLFGGGAKYSCGEDSLFLIDCWSKGLNIYLSKETLGSVAHQESTWFNGINEKYVFDKGAILRAMFPKTYKAIIFLHVFKHRNSYKEFGSLKSVRRLMLSGAKQYS